MDDLISRLSEIRSEYNCFDENEKSYYRALSEVIKILSAQTEQHYCRECKWSRCYIDVDKYGKSEIYWRCLIWDAETDEEGYCHEWKRKQS